MLSLATGWRVKWSPGPNHLDRGARFWLSKACEAWRTNSEAVAGRGRRVAGRRGGRSAVVVAVGAAGAGVWREAAELLADLPSVESLVALPLQRPLRTQSCH